MTWIVSIIFIHVAAQSARQSAELEVELVLAPPCIEYWPGPIMTRVCRYCLGIYSAAAANHPVQTVHSTIIHPAHNGALRKSRVHVCSL